MKKSYFQFSESPRPRSEKSPLSPSWYVCCFSAMLRQSGAYRCATMMHKRVSNVQDVGVRKGPEPVRQRRRPLHLSRDDRPLLKFIRRARPFPLQRPMSARYTRTRTCTLHRASYIYGMPLETMLVAHQQSTPVSAVRAEADASNWQRKVLSSSSLSSSARRRSGGTRVTIVPLLSNG